MLYQARRSNGDRMRIVNFQPIKIQRLSEVIENSIKDLIVTGQLPVGSKLPTEVEISRQFNVSIVTVREALRGLEAFGIIKKKRGKDGGIFVSQPESNIAISVMNHFLVSNKFSADDLSKVRTIIEPAVVSLAASQITPEELKNLKNNIRYCENKLRAKGNSISKKDFFDIEERNVEFHRLIAQATHNPLLMLIVDYMMDFLFSFKSSYLKPNIEFSIKTVAEHRTIVSLLEKGKVEEVQQAMYSHLGVVGGYLTNSENIGNPNDVNRINKVK
jgi:GntR family transcriptional regulator, transcriptional repressor for pyruvate dehydrogenase complex